jgi:hypothetical protein
MEMRDAFTAIDELDALPADWDSYGAPRVEKAPRLQAKWALSEILRAVGDHYARPIVGPTAEAGVALIWRGNHQEVDVLFAPTGGARFVVLSPQHRVERQGHITNFSEFATQILKKFVA